MAYRVRISWEKKAGENFLDSTDSRAHKLTFDSGIELAASSSPHVVPSVGEIYAPTDE